MITRRQTLALTSAALMAAPLPLMARAKRDNPMPDALRRALERDPAAPVLGNPKGDITLTEFFDYNCHFCRKMVPVIKQMIGADSNLRVVFREWPVFGEGSYFAAQAALAALDQGKYWQMHSGLMALKSRATEATVMRVARQVGLDTDRLRADMEKPRVFEHIEGSMELADHMGLVGTPSFIAGDEALFGQQSLKDLQGLVTRGRAVLG